MSRGVQPELSRAKAAEGWEARRALTTSAQAPQRTAACRGSSPNWDSRAVEVGWAERRE